MAISIVSKTVVAFKLGTNVYTPSGLQEGDLMVLVLTVNGDGFNPTGPGGLWNNFAAFDGIRGSFRFWRKVATAADVTAGSFTWDAGNPAVYTGGIMYVFRQAKYSTMVFGFDPPFVMPAGAAQSIVLMMGLSSDNDSDPVTFSAYGITGGMSPTFTEDVDMASNAGAPNVASMGVASGLYTSTANITASTVTFTGTADDNNKYTVIIGEELPPGPANLKSYDENVKSNIKTINTNPIANVKTLDTNA